MAVPDLAVLAAEQKQREIRAKNLRAVVSCQFQVGIVGPAGLLIMPLPEFNEEAAINPWENPDAAAFLREVDGLWTRWRLHLDEFIRSEEFARIAAPTVATLAGHAAVLADAMDGLR